MKKAYRIAAAAISLLLTLVLVCSCMDMETGLVFRKDGTARVYCDITVDEELLKNADMSKEDFLKSISDSGDSDKFRDWNKEEITKTISHKNYIGIRYYKDCACNELKSTAEAVSDSDMTYDIKAEGGKLKVKITVTGSGNGGSETGEYIAQGMMNVKFRICAPYPVLETNGEKDEDGSVCWDLMPVMLGEKESMDIIIDYSVTDTETGIILKDNKNARVYCDSTVDEAALGLMGQTKEDFIRLLSEDGDFEDWSREEITKTVSGANHIGVRYYKDCTCEETEQVFTAVNGSKVAWKVKNEEGKIEVKATVSDNGKSVIKIPEEITGGRPNAKFRISSPLEFIEANGTRDEDGSVYWDITSVVMGSEDSVKITAAYKAAPDFLLIFCIAGGAVLAVAIIITVVLLIRKRSAKKTAHSAPDSRIISEQQPAPAEQPVSTAPAAEKICKACGEKIEGNSKFCIKCGAKQD